MRICDLATGMGQLNHAFGELKERWAEVREFWDDDTRRQFEELHLKPIPPQLQLIVVALDRLSQMVERAERECADRGAE